MRLAKQPVQGEPIEVLVVGVGHLGKAHARVFSELEGVRLAGIVDCDASRAKEVASALGVPHHTELTPEVLGPVHAASVVTPTPSHFAVASRLLEADVSVLVEKPMCSDLAEAQELLRRSREKDVVLQVGHIERFNPVLVAALPYIRSPVFLECERVHPFSFRSAETSVVLDLMIHDIDNALHIVGSPVAELDAFGTPVLSETEDLAYARLTFENGCTAVVKASRVAVGKSRKMRLFSRDSYLSLDFLEQTGRRMSLREGFTLGKVDFRKMAAMEEEQGAAPLFTQFLDIEPLKITPEEPLKAELQAFVTAVRESTEPLVTGAHGVQALDVATRIQTLIQRHNARFWGAGTGATDVRPGPTAR